MQIAVGGCLAQKDRGEITRRAPWVDVVFGTHNIGSLPVLLERARVAARRRRSRSSSRSRSSRPRCRPGASRPTPPGCRSRVGCNNTCTFCIVPVAARQGEGPAPRRHPRRDRGAGRRGRPRGHPARPERQLLRRRVRRPRTRSPSCCGPAATIDGLERVRFTSPHPRDFTDDVIAAMAETPQRDAAAAHAAAVRLRPGAAARCAAPTGRSATSGSSTGSARRCPTRRSPPTSSSGFPGETEADFQATLDVVRAARFAGAFTFQYSTRPGTPAADDGPTRSPRRSSRSATSGSSPLQDEISWAGEPRPGRPRRRGAGRRGRGPQGRRHPPASPAAPATTGWCTSPAHATPAPGDVADRRGDVRGPAPPGRRRPAAGRAPHPRRRRLGGRARQLAAASVPASAGVPVMLGLPGSRHPARLSAGTFRRVPAIRPVAFCPRAACAGPRRSRRGPRSSWPGCAELRRGRCGAARPAPGPSCSSSALGDDAVACTPRTRPGTLAGFGSPVRAGGAGPAVLPLSLTVGAWLLDRCGTACRAATSRSREHPQPDAARPGAPRRPRAADALLVMGDGSATRPEGAGILRPERGGASTRPPPPPAHGDPVAIALLDEARAGRSSCRGARLAGRGRGGRTRAAGARRSSRTPAPYGVGLLRRRLAARRAT